jgi:hypothetical protein
MFIPLRALRVLGGSAGVQWTYESIDIDALFFAMLYYHIKMLIQRSGGTGPTKLRQPVAAGRAIAAPALRLEGGNSGSAGWKMSGDEASGTSRARVGFFVNPVSVIAHRIPAISSYEVFP